LNYFYFKEFLKNWTLIDKNELDLSSTIRNEEEKTNETDLKSEPRVNQPIIINFDGKKSKSQTQVNNQEVIKMFAIV
jgi:hypothetical protein